MQLQRARLIDADSMPFITKECTECLPVLYRMFSSKFICVSKNHVAASLDQRRVRLPYKPRPKNADNNKAPGPWEDERCSVHHFAVVASVMQRARISRATERLHGTGYC